MSSILSSLGLNFGTFLLEIINFVLLFLFLRIFAWPPLVQAMEKRRRAVADQLAAAETERQEAVRLREEQRQALEAARGQAQEIIERAQRAAAEQSREMLEDAKAQAERLSGQVRQEIGREREAAVAALRGEVADLVLLATGKLLRRRVDDAEDRRLVTEFIGAADGADAGPGR
jgi:F-type H+-transporting ATPase subunit b